MGEQMKLMPVTQERVLMYNLYSAINILRGWNPRTGSNHPIHRRQSQKMNVHSGGAASSFLNVGGGGSFFEREMRWA